MCALCVVVVPIKVVEREQRTCLGEPKVNCRLPKSLRGLQQRRMGFKFLVKPGCMDTNNMDARTSSTTNSSLANATSQFYSATIVPAAPKSGDHTNEYDDAIGADKHGAKSGHA
jgi:hypothetical protein